MTPEMFHPDTFPEGFQITCTACGDTAQYALSADFDIVENAVIAQFALFCQRCGKQAALGATVPKRDLAPQDADAEVKQAIAEAIG